MILQERTKAVETMIQQAKAQQAETDDLRAMVKSLKQQLSDASNQRDDAFHSVKDLQLQVFTFSADPF
jgi:seryl-tRNA synthetase